MTKTKSNKFFQFSSFIHSEKSSFFHSSAESIARFDSGFEKILNEAKKSKKHAWISKAGKDLGSFREKIKEQIRNANISRVQIIELLKVKKMTGFQHQFRNKKLNEMTDDELLSVLEDHEILELLKRKKGGDSESS